MLLFKQTEEFIEIVGFIRNGEVEREALNQVLSLRTVVTLATCEEKA